MNRVIHLLCNFKLLFSEFGLTNSMKKKKNLIATWKRQLMVIGVLEEDAKKKSKQFTGQKAKRHT